MSRFSWIVGSVAIVCVWAGSCAPVLAQVPQEITNSIGMKLVLIPRGTFTMGSPIEENGAHNDEEQHVVTISKAFYLGKTEVTQGQYEQVMGGNPSQFQKGVVGTSHSSTYPVERVSWEDAVEFCERLSALPAEQAAGRVYRLPTEAEWEYACRAGTGTAYSFGDNAKSLGDYAWWEENSDRATHPVGGKKANAWGLHDMHGNVYEWCSDWYGKYPKDAVTDPVGPAGGSLRVFRGGCGFNSAWFLRSAFRFRNGPSNRYGVLGFRLALSPSDK
ncbi:MAG: formylglycine-generating enzyme family protein [Pirellulales bacterium]